MSEGTFFDRRKQGEARHAKTRTRFAQGCARSAQGSVVALPSMAQGCARSARMFVLISSYRKKENNILYFLYIKDSGKHPCGPCAANNGAAKQNLGPLRTLAQTLRKEGGYMPENAFSRFRRLHAVGESAPMHEQPQDRQGIAPGSLLDVIRQHKGEVLALVWAFEERAAIAEFDAGMSRADAEAFAWQCVLQKDLQCEMIW